VLPTGAGWKRLLAAGKVLLQPTALPSTGEAKLPAHMRPRIGPVTGASFLPDWAR
jgi:hypothetical protein